MQAENNPQQSKSIFRKEALEQLNSPEQLNEYIHVTTPGVWLGLVALVTALAALLVWGVFGSITVTKAVKGVVHNGVYVCYVDNADELQVGMEVYTEGHVGSIKSISSTPVKSDSLKDENTEHLIHDMNPPLYVYTVTLDMPSADDKEQADGAYDLFDAQIITRRIQPISLILD